MLHPLRSVLVLLLLAVLFMLGTVSGRAANDTTAPVISNGQSIPASIPLSGGSVKVTVQVSDNANMDESGISSVGAIWSAPDGTTLPAVALIRSAGDVRNGTWSGTATVPVNNAKSPRDWAVKLTAKDAAGNVATLTLQIAQAGDAIPPAIRVVDPTPTLIKINGDAPISIEGTELADKNQSGIDSVQAEWLDQSGDSFQKLNLAAPTTNNTQNQWRGQTTLPTNNSKTVRSWTLKIIAKDFAGNVSTLTQQIPQAGDATPPTITDLTYSPTIPAVGGAFSLTATTTDGASGTQSGVQSAVAELSDVDGASISQIALKLSGNPWVGGWSGSVMVPASGSVSSRTWTIKVTATDFAGNSTSRTVQIPQAGRGLILKSPKVTPDPIPGSGQEITLSVDTEADPAVTGATLSYSLIRPDGSKTSGSMELVKGNTVSGTWQAHDKFVKANATTNRLTGSVVFTAYDSVGFRDRTAALEFSQGSDGPFGISGVNPNRGRPISPIVATIVGFKIQPGAEIRLTRPGQLDINGTGVTVASDGDSATVSFDLAGKAMGAWSVVLTNPGGQTATLSGAFTIAQDQDWDIQRDFATGNQPGSSWRFGRMPTNGGSFYFLRGPNPTLHDQPGFITWNTPAGDYTPPWISFNRDNASIIAFGSWRRGEVGTHPGTSDDSVVRWTAPQDGAYTVQGQFYGIAAAQTGVFVRKNGVSQYSAKVAGTGASAPYSLLLNAKAGDTLDFVVSGNHYPTDTTGYEIHIAPATLTISPTHGGNTGLVTVRLGGRRWPSGSATAKLTAQGQPDVVAVHSAVTSTGELTATFDLSGALPGARNVEVRLATGDVVRLSSGFVIDQGGSTDLWVDIIARPKIASGRPVSFTIIVGNNGNVDATLVPIWIGGIPLGAPVSLGNSLIPPKSQPGVTAIDWPTIPIGFVHGNEQLVPLIVPAIGPHETRTIVINTIISGSASFRLRAWTNASLFNVTGSMISAATQGRIKQLQALTGAADCACHASPREVNLNGDCIGKLIALGGQKVLEEWLKKSIPIEGCVEATRTWMTGSFFTTYSLAAQGAGGNLENKDAVQSFVQLLLQTTAVVGTCSSEVPPLKWALGVGIVASALNDVIDGFDAYSSCTKPDPRPAKEGPQTDTVSSTDPNELVGSLGATDRHYIRGTEPLRYQTYFENKPNATAPAQEVVVTDYLDPSLVDLSTLHCGTIQFGPTRVELSCGPEGLTTDVDLRPSKPYVVHIAITVDPSVGRVRWHFTTIDPATGALPEDPTVGFLPPDADGVIGQASLIFTVEPRAGLSSGTQITSKASIVFDVNPPLDTNTWLNTIDNTPPQSQVTPRSIFQGNTPVTVRWSGIDADSGIGSYSIFVSTDAGPFQPWLTNSGDTSAVFPGTSGHTYTFYSVATDLAGNSELTPAPIAAPTLTGISPAAARRGLTSNVVLTGTNFQTGAKVAFGGAGITVNSVSVNSATSLTANVALASDAPQGTYNVSATNPDGQIAVYPGAFTVLSAPAVTAVNPAAALRGQTLDVSLTGADFQSGASLSIKGGGITVNSFTVNSATSASANITVGNDAAETRRDVIVANPDGSLGTGAGLFQVANPNGAPTVTAVSPPGGQLGQSLSATITGSGFQSGATVDFGTGIGVDGVTFDSTTQLSVNLHVSASATAGPRSVRVSNPDGQSGTGSGLFAVTAPPPPAPTLRTVTPNTGVQGDRLTVSLDGSGFQTGTTVSFGNGITANGVTANSSSSLIVNLTIAAGAIPGSRDVMVTNPDGQSATLAGGFSVASAPPAAIFAVTPPLAAQGATAAFRINGSNFRPGAEVSFGAGITLSSVVVSNSQITGNLTVTAGATPGLRDVTVANPGTGAVAASRTFAVTAAHGTGKLQVKAPHFAATTHGQSTQGVLVLSNRGKGSLTVAITAITGPFQVTGSSGPFVLLPKGSMSIPVAFRPLAVGKQSGSVSVISDDPKLRTDAVKLTGVGK